MKTITLNIDNEILISDLFEFLSDKPDHGFRDFHKYKKIFLEEITNIIGDNRYKILISHIDKKESINLKFEESIYELSKINSKTRKVNKLNETESLYLFKCLKKFIKNRKDEEFRCGKKNSFLIKDIYEEIFKRLVNPIYIIILSLISSLVILKPKKTFLEKYSKFLLFFTGFIIILFSELSYKFISSTLFYELIFLTLPITFIFLFYTFLLIKTKLKIKHL